MSDLTRSTIASRVTGRATAALSLAAALVLALQGIWLLYPPGYDGAGWFWFLGAAVLAAFSFAVLQRREGETLPAARPASFKPLGRVSVSALLFFSGVALAVYATAILALYDNHQDMRWAWLVSLGLMVVGSAFLGALGPGTAATPNPGPASRRWRLWLEVAGFLLLVAVGVGLRVYRINQMPPGIFVDETNAALDAIRIMEGRADSPFGTGWFETPSMYAYYLVALFRLLGTTFVALKAASIIPAILTVAVMYPLARLMFGVPTAFAATFLLATNRWHITMSRWGWNEVAPLLFMMGSLYFLQRGVRDRRASDFALGGLLLGLGHYTYLASRLVAVAVVLYLLYRIIFERRFFRGNWRGLMLALVLYLVAVAPLVLTYVRSPFTFSNRTQQVSILHDMGQAYLDQGAAAPQPVGAALGAVGLPTEINLLPLQESVSRHLQMFHAFGDRNPRHNLPGAPMLDPITGGFLILGLGFALWMVLKPDGVGPDRLGSGMIGGHRYALLLLWLLVPLLGGILTRLDEIPQAYRTLPVVGAVALLGGDAAVRSARVFASALAGDRSDSNGTWLRAIPALALGALLLWSASYNYRLYFDVQANDGRVWQAFSPVETAVATEVAAKMDEHSLYLSPRLYYFSPLRFLTYRPPREGGGGLDEPAYVMAEPVTDLPLNDPFGQDALFLLDTYYQHVPGLFLDYYPGARFELVEGPGGQPLYLSVTVPGEEITALLGLNGLYSPGGDQQEIVRQYDDAPRFMWPADLAASAGSDAVASWTGSLLIPESGTYDLLVDGPGRLKLDGLPWTGSLFLGKGLHNLELEQTEPGADVAITLSWQRPEHEAEPVPPNFFFHVGPPTRGLWGQYYRDEFWSGEPAFSRVDPLLLFAWPEQEPWPTPFSVRWTGTLVAPVDGTYRLQLQADDGVRIWIDERLMGEGVEPDTANIVDVEMQLAGGPHAVRIDYFQRAGGKSLEFWWQPPGEILQPVAPEVLAP